MVRMTCGAVAKLPNLDYAITNTKIAQASKKLNTLIPSISIPLRREVPGDLKAVCRSLERRIFWTGFYSGVHFPVTYWMTSTDKKIGNSAP